MDTQQMVILSLGLCLLSLGTSHAHKCFLKRDLRVKALEFQDRQQQQQQLRLAGSYSSCPEGLSAVPAPAHPQDRSLSPWTYLNKTMEGHFPSSYMEAKCLCTGCIVVRGGKTEESHEFNSVEVMQSQMFLKRVPCGNRSTFHLQPVFKEVAVACTCVRVRLSS